MPDSGNEVVVGNKRFKNNGNRKPGITGLDFWEGAFSDAPTHNDMKEILELPSIDDLAGILQRGIYRDETVSVAIVELIDLCAKHKLKRQLETIRLRVASTVGWYGFGRTSQLQVGTGLGFPGVIREQLQMKKVKNGEDVQRGSDFKVEGREREAVQD